MRQITTPRGIEHTDRAIKAVAKQHGIKATDLFAFSALPATRRRQAEVIWRARGEGVAWPDVAEAMGITAERLKGLGIVDKVIAEPLGGAHRDPAAAAESIRQELVAQLQSLHKLDTGKLLERRYERLMSYGAA